MGCHQHKNVHNKQYKDSKCLTCHMKPGMIEQTAKDPESIGAEIDRYLSNPGQALAYMVGQQRILALRPRAQQALGNRFDIRQFHQVILDQGPMPLDVLERQVEAWITRMNAGAGPASR